MQGVKRNADVPEFSEGHPVLVRKVFAALARKHRGRLLPRRDGVGVLTEAARVDAVRRAVAMRSPVSIVPLWRARWDVWRA